MRCDLISTKSNLTAARLREVLIYNPETGVFTWRVNNGRNGKTGCVAGGKSGKYQKITIDGIANAAHRIAWAYTHGEWPEKGYIDHENGNGMDNKNSNLRDATNGENMQNKVGAHKNNKTGLLGVHLHGKSGKYISQIRTNGATKTVGSFNTAEEAHEAYLHAKLKDHPFGKLTPKLKEPPQRLLHRASSSGFTGVEFTERTGRFRAFFNVGRLKKVHVGYFDTALEASQAREAAKALHHNISV